MNIGFLKKILAGLPVLLFTLGIVPSQALALANLVVTPSSAAPGQEVELRVSGVTDQQYFCIYIEGTPAEYNSCNTEKPTKFATTGVNVYKVTIPADVATQNVAFKVPVYSNATNKTAGQVLSGILKVNTAEAQTSTGGETDKPKPIVIPNPESPKPIVVPNLPKNLPGAPTQPDLGTPPLNCADIGLVYDPNSQLCLPANTIAANKDSLAGSLTVGEVITRIIKILLILAGVVAVLFLMIGGYQYIMSRGNPEMAKQGRSTMTSAIIGFIAVLLSYAIVNIITNFVTLGTGSLFK
jgi:hypothetical protein